MIHIFQGLIDFLAPDLLQGWYSFAAMFLIFEFLSNFLPSKDE